MAVCRDWCLKSSRQVHMVLLVVVALFVCSFGFLVVYVCVCFRVVVFCLFVCLFVCFGWFVCLF